MVTCSIRENAEQKIWNRLEHFQHLKDRRMKHKQPDLKIGLLGEKQLLNTRNLKGGIASLFLITAAMAAATILTG